MKKLFKKIFNKKFIKQVFKFGIVGVIATIIDWSIFYVCTNILNIHYAISNVIGFTVSVIFNYYASVKWVFDVNKEKSAKRNFVLFISLSIVGLLLTELLLYIGIELIGMKKFTTKVLASIIVMVFNFVTRKKFLE